MPVEIVDFEARRRARRLEERIASLNERRAASPLPTPEEFGWSVLERDDAGRPARVFNARYAAFAGCVPGDPDLVYLDYRHETRAYVLGLEELLVALETGVVPEPVAGVR